MNVLRKKTTASFQDTSMKGTRPELIVVRLQFYLQRCIGINSLQTSILVPWSMNHGDSGHGHQYFCSVPGQLYPTALQLPASAESYEQAFEGDAPVPPKRMALYRK
ncbi:hypothetical protein HPP92_005628 [Vanilla planifolia]|uniref:Uncharacterized protein n=1 Tax=Vanilla planifolia TaxID=51239 RepID=A0A835RH63_VANPL|nr:hypothetical protein HPP92_005628 [Vanilla planifolia]